MKKDNSQTDAIPQQSDTQQNRSQKPKSKNSKVLICVFAIISVAVIVTLASVIYYLLQSKDAEDQSGPKRDTVVTMDNKDEILADLNNKVADGMFEVKMNVEWSFEDSSTPSQDAYVANNITNSNTVYFDVTLDGTGETVYESPYIPVGSALENIALTSDLSAGTYPCTLTYHLVDSEYVDVSTLAVGVTLYIKN